MYGFDIVNNLLAYLNIVILFFLQKLWQIATVRAIPFASRYGLKLEAILVKPFNFTFTVVTRYHRSFLRNSTTLSLGYQM